MLAKTALQTFKKYTVEPTGIWATLLRWAALDPNRSSGVPLNPLFRNPPPGGNQPLDYEEPVTVPAADIADNPYWRRDVRRAYPRPSVMTQGDVVGLLTVGSKAKPKDDVLQIGDAGKTQLVEVKEEGDKGGLPAFFQKDKNNVNGVLGPEGLPPMPTDLGQKAAETRYEIVKDQAYGKEYPCRTFA